MRGRRSGRGKKHRGHNKDEKKKEKKKKNTTKIKKERKRKNDAFGRNLRIPFAANRNVPLKNFVCTSTVTFTRVIFAKKIKS